MARFIIDVPDEDIEKRASRDSLKEEEDPMKLVVKTMAYIGLKSMMEEGYNEFHIDMKEIPEDTKHIANINLFHITSLALVASKESKEWSNKKENKNGNN